MTKILSCEITGLIPIKGKSKILDKIIAVVTVKSPSVSHNKHLAFIVKSNRKYLPIHVYGS